MDIVQQVFKWACPRPIQCAEETELEATVREFEENEHPHFSLHSPKVPTFENLLNPIRNITSRADHIKGFRFEINIPLSQYFQLSHTWSIPNSGAASKNPMKPPEHPTYTLSAQLVRDVKMNDPQTILSARMDNDGKLEAFFIKRLAPNVSMRITSMFLNSNVEYGMLAADVDIESTPALNSDDNSTMGFKFTNGVFNFSHMERITRRLILGFDYSYMTQQGLSMFGFGGKYNYGNHHFFGQYSPMQGSTTLAYSAPIKKGTMFVSSFTHEKRDNKTTTILGLKQRYINSEILATINSRAKISTALTIFGAPQAPYSLRLCSVVDYLKDTYKFGYGITIGQQM